MHRIPNSDDRTGHALAEALLVANFLEKSDATDENDLVAEGIDLEDGAYGWDRLVSFGPP
jgi:hypothetical protein